MKKFFALLLALVILSMAALNKAGKRWETE